MDFIPAMLVYKRKFADIVCIKMEDNFQRRKILLSHTTKRAAMKSHAFNLYCGVTANDNILVYKLYSGASNVADTFHQGKLCSYYKEI